jgi:hypothetical protein
MSELRRANIVTSSSDMDLALVDVARERMADRLNLDLHLVRPCVALLPPQAEGQRGAAAHVLAVELLRAGVNEQTVLAEVGAFASRCDQPPKATHKVGPTDVRAVVRSAVRTQKRGGLRGYGCKTGILAAICPYASIADCAFIVKRRRPQKRDAIANLLGAFNLARQHRPPRTWTAEQIIRRKWLLMVVAALEVAKGYGGGVLITTDRELEFQSGVPRSTIQRDLRAMAAAGWIEYTPGRSRREPGDLPAGAHVRRLLPGEALEALVREVFPGAEVLE